LGYEATKETLQYIKQNKIINLLIQKDRLTNLNWSIKQVKVKGLFLEFGVYSGSTINFIAKRTENKVYGFDGFEGLPEDFWTYEKEYFKNKIPKVEKNVELVIGWFEDTVCKFMENHDEKIAFVHIDCDVYSSAKTVFDNIYHKIQKGTVIVFDEFWNFPSWQEQEFKAFQEFVKKHNMEYRYLSTTRDIQVTIIITKLNKSDA